MADNNLARNRNDGPDFFADDDPLAELARIVGYDERLVPKPPVADRREPAFNLEDELLREFERYEAPRPHQSSVAAADAVSPPEAFDAPDQFQDVAEQPSEVPAEPVFVEQPAFDDQPSPAVEPTVDAAPALDAETSFDIAPDDQDFFLASGEADLQVDDVQPEPVHAPDEAVWSDVTSQAIAVPVDTLAAEAVAAEEAVLPAEIAPEQDTAEPTFDLSDEVELSIGASDALAPVQEAQLSAARKPIYTPGFRMPLANFNPVREPARAVSLPADAVSRIEPVLGPSDDIRQEPSFGEPQPSMAAFEPVPSIDDVSVAPEPVAAPDDHVRSVETTADSDELPDFDVLAGDTADGVYAHAKPSGPMISEPRWDMPFDFRDDAFSESLQRKPAQPAQALVQPAAVDPMLDEDFELALDDLELDLTDILSDEDLHAFEEPKPAAAPAAVSAPVQPQRFTASWSPVARVVPTPSAVAAAPAPAPYASALTPPTSIPQPPTPMAEPLVPAFTAETAPSLAFDPGLISETEEQPEPVFDLNVPDLQAAEQEPAPVYRNDYDFDIDAELASLLQPVAADAAEAAEPIETAPAEPVPQSAAPSGYLDLDDFERALEQDFRRSLTNPLPAQSNAERLSARSGAAFAESPRRSMAAFAMPLAIAGVVIAGGSVAYALFGGDSSSIAANGEPIVIAADTSPVKVLPANPGGKTVPNQDKAVYDRVAGDVPAAPMQEALISASEEPVDVVQKTLMTDQLPLEGESTAELASASDSPYREDRLTPDAQQADLPPEASQSVSVMPRRVKTMIVRPDGTLVEQEVAAPVEPTVQASIPVETQKVAAASVKNVEIASIPDAPIAGSDASEQGQASGIVPVSADASADMAGLELETPVADQPSIAAPIPTARPTRQPANVAAAVADEGAVSTATVPTTTAAPPAAPQQTQVAALSPGGYVIQIASLPSAADAEKSYRNLSSKFASVIGGRGVDIRAAEIAGKGTFYRVRIPAGSKAEAVQLCESYRAAGGSCLVAK
ncbi:MAG: SPOR domain-containing protein [Pseudorhizobium pelagicum]|uniref:SPOR domain-containing protein n=1 Tax=Pseudorhizobium pelagicum TaxID=1509405 RepID=UPI00345F4483